MTGPELQAIRHRLGLSSTALGRAFGYTGSAVTASGMIRKYEGGNRPLPEWLARLAIMFDHQGVPAGWTELPAPEAIEAPEAEPVTSPVLTHKQKMRQLFEPTKKSNERRAAVRRRMYHQEKRMTFDEWKNLGCVLTNVQALAGLDVSKMRDWADFKAQVYDADRSGIILTAKRLASEGTRGDFIALAAVLMAMDYSSIASDLDQKHGTVLGHWQHTTGERLDALIGVLSMSKQPAVAA